jgi:hypothetical protein
MLDVEERGMPGGGFGGPVDAFVRVPKKDLFFSAGELGAGVC